MGKVCSFGLFIPVCSFPEMKIKICEFLVKEWIPAFPRLHVPPEQAVRSVKRSSPVRPFPCYFPGPSVISPVRPFPCYFPMPVPQACLPGTPVRSHLSVPMLFNECPLSRSCPLSSPGSSVPMLFKIALSCVILLLFSKG